MLLGVCHGQFSTVSIVAQPSFVLTTFVSLLAFGSAIHSWMPPVELVRLAFTKRPAPVTPPIKMMRREYLERIEQRSATAPPRSFPQNEIATYSLPPARIVSGGQPGSSRRHALTDRATSRSASERSVPRETRGRQWSG